MISLVLRIVLSPKKPICMQITKRCTSLKEEIPNLECAAFPKAVRLPQDENDLTPRPLQPQWTSAWVESTFHEFMLTNLSYGQVYCCSTNMWLPRGRGILIWLKAHAKIADPPSDTASSENLLPESCLLGPFCVEGGYNSKCVTKLKSCCKMSGRYGIEAKRVSLRIENGQILNREFYLEAETPCID